MKQFLFILIFIFLLNVNVFAEDNFEFERKNDLPQDFTIITEEDFNGEVVEEKQFNNLEDDERILGETESLEAFVGSFIDGNFFLQSQKSYWDQYTNNYIYNQLSPKEKNLWNNLDDLYYELLLTDKDYNNEWAVVNLDFEDFNDLFNQATMYKYSHPQFYFLTHRITGWRRPNSDGSYDYGLCIFLYDKFKDGKKRQESTELIKKQLNEWTSMIKQESSEYSRIKFIHDLITDKVDYDYDVIKDDYDWGKDDHYSQSIYSVIATDKTVCSGYAQTYSCLANYASLNNCAVTGSGHAWDYTKINDYWYNIDLTWDDSRSFKTYKYFLVSDDFLHRNDSSHFTYSYWNQYIVGAIKNYSGYESYNGTTYYSMPSLNSYDIVYKLGNAKAEDFSGLYWLPLGYSDKYSQNIPSIKRVGYKFLKWTDEDNKKITKTKKKTGDLKLTANWEPITYNIKYAKGTKGNTKGVFGSMKASKNLRYDEGYTLANIDYIKPGYKFIGWTDDKKGTEVKFLNQQRISNLRDTGGTVQLYALWEKE